MDTKDVILEKLKAENQLLKAENVDLKRENSLLKEIKYDNDYLESKCAELEKKIEELEN